MAFRVPKLGETQLGLFLDQRASDTHVLVSENTKGKFQVFNNALVKHREFSRSFLRELVLVLDLLAGQLHQILVDDVANMFEVDGEGDYLHGASRIAIIKAFAGHFGDVKFYRFVQSIDDVVHARDFGRELAVVAHQCRIACRSRRSTTSPMCSVSRAAQANAADGMWTAVSSR